LSEWPTAAISELCDVVNGGTPRTGEESAWGGSHMWITPAEMGGRSSPYADSTDRRLTDLGLRAANLLPPNSVILSTRAPIGHLVINTVPMATNQGCKGLVPRPGLDAKYLYYFLASKVPLLNELGTGTTFKELSGSRLKEVRLPVAPLAEQQRIVAILDEAFAGLATATANVERNVKNAQEVLAVRVATVATNKAWPVVQIGDVAQTQYGLSVPLNSEGRGFKTFRMGEVRNGLMVDTGAMKFADISPAEVDEYRLRRGDVLFNRTNSYELVGKTGYFDLLGEYVFASYLVRVRFSLDRVRPRFASYVMNSGPFLATVRAKAARSVNQANVNATILRNEPIRLPDVATQSQVVDELEELDRESRQLQQRYASLLDKTERLRQTLMEAAFAGELTSPPLATIREAAE
jgi:type I restriction enzyme, S subunit